MLDDSTSRSHAFLGDPHELLAYNLSTSDPNATRSVIEQQPVGLGGEQKCDGCSYDGVTGSSLRFGARLLKLLCRTI